MYNYLYIEIAVQDKEPGGDQLQLVGGQAPPRRASIHLRKAAPSRALSSPPYLRFHYFRTPTLMLA